MKSLNVVFPHQLFQNSPIFENKEPIYLVEEYLFFKHYKFHKQKIAFHRATMKWYADYVTKEKNIAVTYIESTEKIADIRFLIPELKRKGIPISTILIPQIIGCKSVKQRVKRRRVYLLNNILLLYF